jgi:hypothetical protein
MRRMLVIVLLLLAASQRATALKWVYPAPNPAFSRDLALGMSTIAEAYPPQSQSINPAGLSCFAPETARPVAIFFNPGGLWQLRRYIEHESGDRTAYDQATETVRLLVNTFAVRWKVVTLAGMFGQPVMLQSDTVRYDDYDLRSSLEEHQNSLVLAFNLHRRIAVAGRIDRYYRYSDPQGEGYSYGVILRPRHVELGLQYQRYPASGARVWHPLDRRSDQSIAAGVAVRHEGWSVSAQVMNVEQSSDTLELEPRMGVEWRPWRALALRAGGASYADGDHWAWTAGLGILDANWLHVRAARLSVPDDLVQVALAVIYRGRTPELGLGSLTMSWRL